MTPVCLHVLIPVYTGLNAIAAVSSTKAGDAAEMDKLSFKALEVYKEALPKDHPNIATGVQTL